MTQHPIDVHLIRSPSENIEWLALCKTSLYNHPINVYEVNGIVGDVMQTRINGFSLGSAEYVSFVDADDIVLTNAFQHCLDYLNNNIECNAVFTNSYRWATDGKLKPWFYHQRWTKRYMESRNISIHQIVVIRRTIMEQALSKLTTFHKQVKMALSEQVIYAQVSTLTDFHFLHNIFGYKWRQHVGGTHELLNDDIQNLFNQVRNDILTSP